jgi:16S rRNA (adenine1518-N6/adenine1519-N6)-dimethyltransferase
MKLSEMRQILAERGIQLTKSLGQNFLHDANQLKKIAAAAELTPRDKVLEVGPGLGPLTQLLVEQTGEVLAIEKDARLVEILKERFASNPNLTVLHEDALHFLKNNERDWTDWKLVANLPYSVGSPILVELAQAERPPQLMTVTLQLEVVRRLVAEAGSTDYGILTLLVQLNYEPGALFKIPSGSFFPPPDVDSGCITLQRRAKPLLEPAQRPTFAQIVKRSFSQRRKMMIKLLREDWPADRVASAFRVAGIADSARAETVSLEQYVTLTRELSRP